MPHMSSGCDRSGQAERRYVLAVSRPELRAFSPRHLVRRLRLAGTFQSPADSTFTWTASRLSGQALDAAFVANGQVRMP